MQRGLTLFSSCLEKFRFLSGVLIIRIFFCICCDLLFCSLPVSLAFQTDYLIVFHLPDQAGISGILSPAELKEAMSLPPDEGCRLLETMVREKALPAQDNYTGVMIAWQSEKTGERRK